MELLRESGADRPRRHPATAARPRPSTTRSPWATPRSPARSSAATSRRSARTSSTSPRTRPDTLPVVRRAGPGNRQHRGPRRPAAADPGREARRHPQRRPGEGRRVSDPLVARTRGELARGAGRSPGARPVAGSRSCPRWARCTPGTPRCSDRARRWRRRTTPSSRRSSSTRSSSARARTSTATRARFDADLAVCADAGRRRRLRAGVEEVYPGGEPAGDASTRDRWAPSSRAPSRPTHFRGVLTVVAKLFGLVRPDVAVFGAEGLPAAGAGPADGRRPLHGRSRSSGAETVREADGLALSSRNRYLSADERALAPRALGCAAGGRRRRAAGRPGRRTPGRARRAGGGRGRRPRLPRAHRPRPRRAPAPGPARLLVAARVGATRLIDNVALTLEA